jgi:hypothetical protein
VPTISTAVKMVGTAQCAFAHPTDPNLHSSSPAKAGDPVRRGLSIRLLTSLEYRITRPSAQLRTRRVMTVCVMMIG